MAGSSYTPAQFAQALLTHMGLPASPANIDFITSWAAAEGGHWNNSATYNPLNTTLHMPGSGPMGGNPHQNGGTPVQAYTSWEQGVEATAKTLEHYSGIVGALKQSNAQAAAQAVVNSPWGTKSLTLGTGASYSQQSGASAGHTAGVTSAGSDTTTVTGNAGTDVADYLSSSYGYLSSFLKDPEIGPILQQAAAGGWSDARLEGALSATNWWKTTGATARSWVSLNRIDPATAKAQLATTQAHVKALATAAGVSLSSQDMYHIAYASNMFGWSDLQLQQSIGAQYKYNPKGNNQSGAGLSDIQQMKQIAADYMVPVADKTLQQYAQQALSGNYNINDFESYAKEQALSLFANNKTMVNAINSGIKPTTFVDPYRQLIAQTTEVDPNAVDFMNPKYMKFINQIDPKSGVYAPMSLSDTATTLRTNPVYGYDKTQQARQDATNLSTQIGQKMGFI
jgi:hypothetical protein